MTIVACSYEAPRHRAGVLASLEDRNACRKRCLRILRVNFFGIIFSTLARVLRLTLHRLVNEVERGRKRLQVCVARLIGRLADEVVIYARQNDEIVRDAR